MKRERFLFRSTGGTEYEFVVDCDKSSPLRPVVTMAMAKVPEARRGKPCDTDPRAVHDRAVKTAGTVAGDMILAAMCSIVGTVTA